MNRSSSPIRSRMTCVLCSLAVAAGFAPAAFAQEETAFIEEIVVVSQKREQTLQSLPVAVSVVSKQQLDEAQILDVKDLQFLVPSLRVSTLQTSANTTFLIRGFGNGANNAGVEPSVGVFVMVWTVMGASPPTGTLPTMIWRDWRRSIVRQGLISDMKPI